MSRPVMLARAAVCGGAVLLAAASAAAIQEPSPAATTPSGAPGATWHGGGFLDGAYTADFNSPPNHRFRNRGTTPRVDELDVNMMAAYIRKNPVSSSRWGVELTGQTGEDAKIFGFSATAPNVRGAGGLRHLGPTNVSYLAPVGGGLTLQGGIFSSLIGYDALYAKDNFAYSRPWGADYTPYLMLGVNASYPFTATVTGTVAVVNGYWHLAHANDVASIAGQVAVKATDWITIRQTALYGPHQSNTALELWRVLSDTIVEGKTDQATVAFEYQIGSETIDAPGRPRALWMAAQAPVRWTLRPRWSLSVRPEIAWDRDGRWIGSPQSVAALTSTLEYRVSNVYAGAVLRIEHRIDDSRGTGGGFFRSAAGADGNVLTPVQNLVTFAVILTFDASTRE